MGNTSKAILVLTVAVLFGKTARWLTVRLTRRWKSQWSNGQAMGGSSHREVRPVIAIFALFTLAAAGAFVVSVEQEVPPPTLVWFVFHGGMFFMTIVRGLLGRPPSEGYRGSMAVAALSAATLASLWLLVVEPPQDPVRAAVIGEEAAKKEIVRESQSRRVQAAQMILAGGTAAAGLAIGLGKAATLDCGQSSLGSDGHPALEEEEQHEGDTGAVCQVPKKELE